LIAVLKDIDGGSSDGGLFGEIREMLSFRR